MPCINCGSDRVLQVTGKVDDRCHLRFDRKEHNGYVPADLNIGEGDYLEFDLCLDCGLVQGEFPVGAETTEVAFEDDGDGDRD